MTYKQKVDIALITKGMKFGELAKELGMSRQYLHAICIGQKGLKRRDEINKILGIEGKDE